MRAATLFSGIGAPEAARPDWHWLWHAEIEPFPAAVLAAHHPRSVNLGDVTAHDIAHRALAIGRPDVLVFGSPCQSFSVAGKRLGLDDPRGNLALVALAVVRRVRPRWLVFENVPGLLSSGGGDDFAAFLAAVQECGYLGCWRVLDARHWGLAQRRQRVFFVGCLGDWRGPAEVLSLAEGLRGYPAAGDEAGQEVARPLSAGSPGGSGYRNDADTAENLIAHAFDARQSNVCRYGDIAASLDTQGHTMEIMSFHHSGYGAQVGDIAATLQASDAALSNQVSGVIADAAIRRLTPVECERLQGFPDNHTAIPYRGKPAADGPRYRALGNSMAVPVVRWLLGRIEAQPAATATGENAA